MRGEGGVADEGRVVGVPTLHSWCKCNMPLMNINSDWMSNTYSGLCINFFILFTRFPLFRILGCNVDPLFHILGCNYVVLYYVDPLFRILGCNIYFVVFYIISAIVDTHYWNRLILLKVLKMFTRPC